VSGSIAVTRHLLPVDFSTGQKGDLILMEMRDGRTSFTDVRGNDVEEDLAKTSHFYVFIDDTPSVSYMIDSLMRVEHYGSSIILRSLCASRNPEYPALAWLAELTDELQLNDIWFETMERNGLSRKTKITDTIRLEM